MRVDGNVTNSNHLVYILSPVFEGCKESLNINREERIIALTAEGRSMETPQAVFFADGQGNQMIEDNRNMKPRGEKIPEIKIRDIKGSLKKEVPLQVGSVRLIAR